jgi:transcriptional regulator with PAS, ATPase and Fis domain
MVQTTQWEESTAALTAVSAVFESLGRVLICLDADFRVVHASRSLVDLAGASIAKSIAGRPVEELLGPELFGRGAELRRSLETGGRREGWNTLIRTAEGIGRLLSLTAAPLQQDLVGLCDGTARYIIVLRAAEQDPWSGTSVPTLFGGMIGRSAAMRQIFQLVENLQASEATVLLSGESGTGKEVLARAIHANSPRRHGRFVTINCAALPGEMLEGELFGHARGGSAAAAPDRAGRLELAAGGTLFLDEIGDVPVHLQVKLLRVLQERTYERVGESHPRAMSARIIAASDVDLRRAVAEGRFREDFYYRLRVVSIEIPPLRTRREDIEPLARYLLARIGARHGRDFRFSPDAVRGLTRYRWPGNVRELENAIEYSAAVARRPIVQTEDLPLEILEGDAALPAAGDATAAGSEPRSEEDAILAALERHRWQRETTARALGMSRTTLWRKMRELGLR